MSEEPIAVTIKVLDKEYRIACGQEERHGLVESARMLDQRMREIRQSGRVIGSERIAVLAALNIAHELVQVRLAKAAMSDEQAMRLNRLQERIAETLAGEPALDDSA